MNGTAETTTPVSGDASPGYAFPDSQSRLRADEPVAATIQHFVLYVAGDARNGALALTNLTAFCHAHLLDRHTIEIVDVLEQPGRALADRIYLTPTLVVLAPGAVRRIVGTLEDSLELQRTFGIATEGS